MHKFIGRSETRLWTAVAPLVVGLTLSACGGEAPSSPSPPAGAAPVAGVEVLAAASGPLSVSPRNIHLKCSQGSSCDRQVVVTSSSPLTLTYSLDGDFVINSGATSCPQGGTLSGACTIGIQLLATELPGRRSGTLTISESTFGTSRTVRLAARVS